MLCRFRRIHLTFGATLALGCTLLPVSLSTVLAAPTSLASSSDVVVKRGDQSLKVVQVQQLLIAAGISVKGGADGIFGPGTETAVKTYQGQRGLTVNGVVDTPTAIILGIVPARAVVAKGSSGAAVKAVQQQLMAVGVSLRGGADGSFGASTMKAVQEFQSTHHLRVSGVVDAATAEILANAAAAAPATPVKPVTSAPAVDSRLASFPVPATCKFWDTWGAPRSGGRKHEGVDIAAAEWTPVFAVQNGKISRRQADYQGSRAGNAIWLTASNGTYYFYGHLSAFAKGVGVGSPVRSGDVIGYVGSTGNAEVPHLHLEVHPNGGGPVNPYPILKAASSCA
jgi:peptidoglycan hydrolase-like protein with peptidoglycan-binding domain